MNAPVVAKPQMNTGGALSALVPQNLDDMFRVAKALSLSGDMVPKHFQGNAEMIMAAVMRGAEIGLMPMQALSNIAVINGRASLWGDALPALMQRAGHHIDTEVTGEGDAMVATATLTRGDTGRTITRSFSAADAKAAGLWGKAGPWQQYKPRMLSMRARAWACRDGAADTLMGLQVVEEMQDAEPRDITPATPRLSPLAAIAAQAKQAATVEHTEAQDMAPASHWTEGVDWDANGTPGSDAWDEGALAWQDGFPSTNCPHDADPAKAADWLAAWHGAARAAE